MTIMIKNTQYFEWEIPYELIKDIKSDDYGKLQDIIDEYFDISSTEVEQVSDDYYEIEQTYTD